MSSLQLFLEEIALKARIIINPSAGRQLLQKQVDRIIGRLLDEQTIRHADVIRTQGAGDAYQAARYLKSWEADFVMAVGGDGTVNEVINGLMDGHHQTPLAILPAGTVNDFAHALRLPRDTTEFCAMIRRFQTIPVDVGRAGDRYFLNVAAGGMLTDVAYKVPSEAKTVLGKMAYLISGAMDLQVQKFSSIHLRIESDEKTMEEEVLLFIIANSTSVGGFRSLAPQASVNDGRLDVLVIHKQNLFELVPVLLQMVNGDHITNNRISYFQTRELRISCLDHCPVPLDLDGEQGQDLPVTVGIVPSAIRLIVPTI